MNGAALVQVLLALTLCYTAMGRALSVVDGDTFDAELRVWSNVTVTERVRVYGVDTPEMKGADRPAGLAAAAFTESWLRRGGFSLRTCGRDSFGRVLGVVSRPTDGVLAEKLIEAKHGVEYRK